MSDPTIDHLKRVTYRHADAIARHATRLRNIEATLENIKCDISWLINDISYEADERFFDNVPLEKEEGEDG